MATFDDFHGHVFSDEAHNVGPVDVIDAAHGEVSQRIWDILFPILNCVNEHMSLMLKNAFQVGDAEISPFAAEFSGNVRSILDRFLAYMTRTATARTTAAPEAPQQDVHENNDNSNTDTKDEAVLTTVQEGLMEDLIHAAAATDDDEDDKDEGEGVHADNDFGTDNNLHGFVQQIYGGGEVLMDEMVQNFAALLTCNQDNRKRWPTLLAAAFDNLVMKSREKGATVPAQKFKGLNFRWFGPSKKDEKKVDSDSGIRRGTAVTVEGYGSARYIVMAVFSKSYNKWFMCDDKPCWCRDDKKHAPCCLSI